jgi:hypothetical protein
VRLPPPPLHPPRTLCRHPLLLGAWRGVASLPCPTRVPLPPLV